MGLRSITSGMLKTNDSIIADINIPDKHNAQQNHIYKSRNIPGLSKKISADIVKTILNYTDAERIILFGSRARGDFQKTSDIDVAIKADKNILPIKDILDDEIDTLLKFDVVDLSTASKELEEEIEKEGIVIYEKKD